MGQSHIWFMYARKADDYWQDDPLYLSEENVDNIEYHMGRFKHKFFLYGLNQFENVHKLYLYQGRTRYVKCWHDGDCLKVEFNSAATKQAWLNSKRSKKGIGFDRLYTVKEENDWNFVFKKTSLD